MFPLDERLIIGLKVLERLRPNLNARKTGCSPSAWTQTKSAQTIEGSRITETESYQAQSQTSLWAPSLESLLKQTGPLPPYSLILGACEDGLPFLLDLTNPAPGAILIVGDADSGKTRLLKAILASAIYLNPPDQVSFHLVAHELDEFLTLPPAENQMSAYATGDSATGELIQALLTATEERRKVFDQEPAVILAIDGLAPCERALDYQTFAHLYRLIKHGPRSRVWTIATLSSEQVNQIDRRLLAAFRTRLVGFIADWELAKYLSGEDDLNLQVLVKGDQFCVPYGEEWFQFWICDPVRCRTYPHQIG